MRNAAIIVLFGMTASLAGCGRDPANEQPMTMKPGLYEVKLTGGGMAQMAQSAPGATKGEICVGDSDTDYFPKRLAKNYLSMGPTCGSVDLERVGNQVTGKFSCGVDPVRATGEINVTFSGIVSEERFDLDAQMKWDTKFNDPEAQREMESSQLARGVPIKLVASRKGDCQS